MDTMQMQNQELDCLVDSWSGEDLTDEETAGEAPIDDQDLLIDDEEEDE